jgi:acyl-CoA thioesterase II
VGLRDILTLAADGTGTGPAYPWGGLYGGQIVGQALAAASATVEDDRRPHSLRAYFIHPGDSSEPVAYEVDRLRDGRSFTTRRVVARQAIGAILNLEASYTGGDPGPSISRTAMPAVPAAEELPVDSWTGSLDRRVVPPALGSGVLHTWLRVTEPTRGLDDEAFAFLSDVAPSDAIRCMLTPPDGSLDDFDEDHFAVSLDHTVWFHEPVLADEWHLHAFTCDRIVGGRALTSGRVFTADGRHVASIAQEMLVRQRRR